MSEIQSPAPTDNGSNCRTGRKMRFSYNDADIQSIWDCVSEFIESNMMRQKGVSIPNFGQFSFNQIKLDIGQSKYVLLQRPLFVLSEKVCQNHGLKQNKVQITGSVPVVPLNYSSLMLQSNYTRDQIETCVRELITATNQSIAGSGTELIFTRIGRLQIRDQQVKFKFYKNFIASLDNTGKVINAMQNRPGTADSVMSDRSTGRMFSSVIPLPKISNGQLEKLPSIHENETFVSQRLREPDILTIDQQYQDLDPNFPDEGEPMPGLQEDYSSINVGDETVGDPNLSNVPDINVTESINATDIDSNRPNDETNNYGSTEMPNQLLIENEETNRSSEENMLDTNQHLRTSMPLVLPTPKPPSRASLLENCETRKRSSVHTGKSCRSGQNSTRPSSAASSSVCCGSTNQDLCYVCYQRERRNVPVSFTDQLKERDREEERVLQSYQNMKDKEHLVKEQEKMLSKKHDIQKAAAYNLGVAEAIKNQKTRDPNAYRSFIFEHRPLTPPKIYKQNLLSNDLSKQVEDKSNKRKKAEDDESFMERLEQMQLAEDLAKQRDQYLNNREQQKELYKRALDAQVNNKPTLLAKSESDSIEPFFGKNDVTNEKLLEKRRKAQEILKTQLEVVEQKKRDALMKRIQEQSHEEKVLDRVKNDLIEDRAKRYERSMRNRLSLEKEWQCAKQEKQERDLVDRLKLSMADDVLLHEQCDKYHRCAQCKRKLNNHGTTNIWKETYFIPGSRYIY